jgi:hypothetical protein
VLNGEQLPLAGNPLEGVRGALGELDSRACYEILDSARDEDLTRGRNACDARSDVHCDTRELSVGDLTLSCVDCAAQLSSGV